MKSIIVIFLMICMIGCNIFKVKPVPVNDWSKTFFNFSLNRSDIKSIYSYKILHQRINFETKQLLDIDDSKNLLDAIDSLEYVGYSSSQRLFAFEVCLQDTSLYLWGNNKYIGPYKSDKSYVIKSFSYIPIIPQ